MKRPSSPLPVVARYVLVEARRSGLPWVAAVCVLAVMTATLFLARVTLSEGAALQAAAAAALLRAAAVFVLAAHVIASVTREANDRGLDLALALPVSRSAFYLGKLLGFGALALVLACVFALPLLAWARPADVAAWGLSLALEAALVGAAALLFASVLAHNVAAIAATAGLYLLARAMAAIQAIAAGPLAEDSAAGRLARQAVDAIALLLPRLDAATRSDWLLYGAPAAGELALLLAGLALYILLLAAAGLFDFTRRNL
jgi:ABC-type transport system involved in multi-copper enzyme maturation permease subunit